MVTAARRVLPNALRLGAFVAAVLGVGLLCATRAAADQRHERWLHAGTAVLRYADGHALGTERRLSFNGAELSFAVGSTTDAVPVVLEHYAARCTAGDTDLAAELAADPAARARPSREPPSALRAPTVLRQQDDARGFVACLDPGPGRPPAQGLLARLREYARTSDLRAIGRLRYVYAERAEGGRTRVLGLWADGALSPRMLFAPAGADAPGENPAGFAPVPGLHRALSVREHGVPSALAVYTTTQRPLDLVPALRASLAREGWRLEPGRSASAVAGNVVIRAEREGAGLAVVVDAAARADRTAVTVLAGR